MSRPNARLDAFYTPQWAAEALASALPDSLAGGVLDPAVGGGALLAAVERRFGDEVSLLGLDVSSDAVRTLREMHPAWSVSTADLLRVPSRAASQAWRAARKDLGAVVMNPPFSYRGNGGASITYGRFQGRVAPSMHFVTEVVRSLDPSEGFYAILPDGALDAERHEDLWEQLRTEYTIDRMARLRNSSFEGARVSTSIVRLYRSLAPVVSPTIPMAIASAQLPPRSPAVCRCLDVVRGRVPLHALPSLSLEGVSAPFVHTTDLQATVLSRSAPDRLADVAPLLLISRVGRWRRPRLIEVGRVVLSDCLFGLRPRTQAGLVDLVDSLLALELELQAQLRGTGAPYLTLTDVSRVLGGAGWHVQTVRAGEPPSECGCGQARDLCDTGSGG